MFIFHLVQKEKNTPPKNVLLDCAYSSPAILLLACPLRGHLFDWRVLLKGLEANLKLVTLEIANNLISVLDGLGHLPQLEEFWANNNKIANWAEVFNNLVNGILWFIRFCFSHCISN